tara:strand:- start:607 stop:1926 length:1320 start_codon:yes stop_codon:yes gene_type:complete
MKSFLKIIFLLPLFTISQEKDSDEIPINIALDSINKQIIYLTNKSLYFVDSKSLKILNKKKIKGPKVLKFNAFVKKSKLLFLDKKGGDILKLNTKDSLVKIDNSNIHNFFLDNVNFIKNDTLFKHGGYGYWSQSNFITYYDELTKEWEIYTISSESEIPRSADSHIGINWGSNYSFFGGTSLTENGSRIKNRGNRDVWNFNFVNKKWSLLGSYEEDNLNQSFGSFNDKGDLYILDETRQLYKITIYNNKITSYKRTPKLYDIENINPLFYNGFVYYINKKRMVSKIQLKEITKDIYNKDTFYSKNNTVLIFLITLIIIMGLSALLYYFRRFQKDKKIQLLENGIQFKNKFIDLDSLSISLIKVISKKDMDFSEVMDIVSQDHLSKMQNERIRNQMITQINLKLKVITKNSNDFLIVSKSTFDKRYKVISINNSDYGNIL